MNREKIVREENKKISETILKIMQDTREFYKEKKYERLEQFEIEKREKYNSDNLFKNKSTNKENKGATECLSKVDCKESLFIRFINRIKHFFNK